MRCFPQKERCIMAKKQAKSFLKFGNFIAAALAILAVLTIFRPAVQVDGTENTTYTGLQAAFGYSESALGVTTQIFNFSFLTFLAYLLPIAGVVLSLLNRKGTSTLFSFLSAGCYIVGAVFMFLAAGNIAFADSVLGKAASLLTYVLTPWSIIGGVLLCLSGLVSLANVFLK